MNFKERLISVCTEKCNEYGRKLTSGEIVNIAVWVHNQCVEVDTVHPSMMPGGMTVAEKIYVVYPLKVAKEEALRAIANALRKVEYSYLMDRTAKFADSVNTWPASFRFTEQGHDLVPKPSNWYTQGRYDDDPSTWKRFGTKKEAPTYTPPPEPTGWREFFPDFIHKDMPWNQLQPVHHHTIINEMAKCGP